MRWKNQLARSLPLGAESVALLPVESGVFVPVPLDSILDAVLTVSPNRQYLGILWPTTPATHEPGTEN